MQLLMPHSIQRRMKREMRRARKREIGGILMGEELGVQRFRIADFSVDAESGSNMRFVRDSEHHERELEAFFQRTGDNYRRFNYLGEWHTHPNFEAYPSLQDIHAMQDLVHGSCNVDFAVLFIARLRWIWKMECSALLFVRCRQPIKVEVVAEQRK